MNLKNSRAVDLLEKKWVILPLVFFISLAFFGWLQSAPTLADPDSFYHAGMAQLMSEQGIVKSLPWAQETILKDGFADHHFLYHVMLVPLVNIFDPLIAVKIGSVILSSLFMLLLAWYLKQKNIKYVWVYLFVLLTLYPFLIRMSLAKATPLALLWLFLGMYLVERKKYLFLFLLSFVYVWSHGGFVLLPIVALILFGVEIVYKKIKNNYVVTSRDLSLPVILSGIIAGLIINPYFPKNLSFYWQQVVQIGLVNYKDKIEVGAEWYMYKPQDLIGATSIAWIVVVLAVVIFVAYRKKMNLEKYQWLILIMFFLVATVRSRRFVEYLLPVIFIWCALVINWFISSEYFFNQKQKFLQVYRKEKFWLNILFIYLCIAIPFGMGKGIMNAKNHLDQGFSFSYLRTASEYLRSNTQSAETIFHARWDDWPMLFYHNPKNYYIVGLDPTFMYNYDQSKYKLWTEISEGKVKNNLAQTIKNNFNTKYIIVVNEKNDTKLFRAYCLQDKNIELIYKDEETSIFHIAI